MKHRVILSSYGRSGSKWLQNLLDLSERTFCRLELDETRTSPFRCLKPGTYVEETHRDLELNWNLITDMSSQQQSVRDICFPSHKVFIKPYLSRLNIPELSRRVQKKLNTFFPNVFYEDWNIPNWWWSPSFKSDVIPVLNIHHQPRWVCWALENDRLARHLHIVRHPGGMLNGLLRRYVRTAGEANVLEANRERLKGLVSLNPHFASLIGDPNELCLEESELWYWRYFEENVLRSGREHPDFYSISFEELARNPMTNLQEIYKHCGLEWSETIERQSRALTEKSQAIADGWKHQLTDQQKRIVNRVLEGSELQSLWEAYECPRV